MTPISRRQLLAAGGLATLGMPLRRPIFDALADIGTAPHRSVAASSPYSPLPPYQVSSHSNLSQDYFVSSDVTLDPTSETAIPIVRSDGSQAILIAQQGQDSTSTTLSLVLPDGTTPSGYVNMSLGSLANTISITVPIAATAGPNNTIDVLYMDATTLAPTTATIAADGTVGAGTRFTNDRQSSEWVLPRIAIDAEGRARCVVLDPQPIGLTVYEPNLYIGDPGSVAAPIPVVGVPQGTGSGSDFLLADASFVVAGPDSAPNIVGVTSTHTGELGLIYGPLDFSALPQYSTVQLPPPLIPTDSLLIPVQPLPSPIPAEPSAVAALLWIGDGVAYAVTCDTHGNPVTPPVQLLSHTRFQISTGPVTSAAWFQDPTTHLITVFLLAGGTVYKQTLDFSLQAPDTAPIPLQSDVNRLYLPAQGLNAETVVTADRQLVPLTLATESTEVVGFLALGTLSRRGTLVTPDGVTSPGGAWVSAPVQCAQPTYYQIDTYRTMLTVTDAAGTPVPNVNMYITPQLDVLAFRTTGGVVLPAGVETAVQTDQWGQVCLCAPATSLNSSPMSVRCDTGAGTSRSTPMTVAPDGELHAFLAGTAPLNAYPTVSNLITEPNPQNVFSKISGNSQAVTAVSSAINAAVTAGMQPTTPPNTAQGPTAFTLTGLDTATPTYTENVSVTRAVGGPSWWDDFKNDLESVWKAVERGIAKVTQIEHGWDNALKQWFVNLTIDIEGYVANAINYVITDLRSALVAVHGIFQAIGAEISALIKLVRTLVDDIMKDTEAIADTLYSWITYDPSNPGNVGMAVARNAVDDLIADAKQASGKFFQNAEDDLRKQITNLTSTAGGYTPNSSKAYGTSSTSASRAPATGASHNSRSTWLLEKTRSASLPSSASPANSVSAATAGIASGVGSVAAPTQAMQSASQNLPSGSDPHDLLDSLSMDKIAAIFLELLVDGLEYLDEAIDSLLDAMAAAFDDLNAFMTFELDDLPVIGELLKIFGIKDLTVGKLLCLIMGFGMAVIGDLAYGGNGWLPTPVASNTVARSYARSVKPGLRAEEPSWTIFLNITSLLADAFSEIPTVYMAPKIAEDPEYEPPLFLQIVEMVFGVVENAVFFPFNDDSDAQSLLVWESKTGQPGLLLGERTPLYSWALGFTPLIVQAITAKLSTSEGDSPVKEAWLNQAQFVLTSDIGMVNMCIDIYTTVKTITDKKALAIGILVDVFAWLPTALMFLCCVPGNAEIATAWVVVSIATPIVLIILEAAELA